MKKLWLLSGYLLMNSLCWAQNADSLAHLAVRYDPELIRAERRITLAKIQKTQAAALSPLELTFTWGGFDDFSSIQQCDEKSLGLVKSFSWPGKRSTNQALADREINLAVLQFEHQLKLKTAQIHELLLQRLYHQRVTAYMTDLAPQMKKLYEVTNAHYALRQSAYSDLMTIRMEITLLEQEIENHRQEITQLETSLQIMTGLDSVPTPDTSAWILKSSPYSSLQNAQTQLTQNSYQLKMSQTLIQHQELNRRLSRQDIFPSFSFGLSHTWNKNDPPFNLNDYQGQKGQGWDIEGSISIPFFFLSSTRTPIKTTELEYQTKTDIVARVNLALPQIIADSYRRLLMKEKQLRRYEENILQNGQKEIQNILIHYAAGSARASDVILYLHSFSTYRNEYEKSCLEYLLAMNELEICAEKDPFTGKEENHEN